MNAVDLSKATRVIRVKYPKDKNYIIEIRMKNECGLTQLMKITLYHEASGRKIKTKYRLYGIFTRKNGSDSRLEKMFRKYVVRDTVEETKGVDKRLNKQTK